MDLIELDIKKVVFSDEIISEWKNKDELLKILAVYLKIDVKLDAYIFELEKTKDIDSLKKEIIKTLKELKL